MSHSSGNEERLPRNAWMPLPPGRCCIYDQVPLLACVVPLRCLGTRLFGQYRFHPREASWLRLQISLLFCPIADMGEQRAVQRAGVVERGIPAGPVTPRYCATTNLPTHFLILPGDKMPCLALACLGEEWEGSTRSKVPKHSRKCPFQSQVLVQPNAPLQTASFRHQPSLERLRRTHAAKYPMLGLGLRPLW